ncbi:MAG: DegT/DnrJ/EryC1/StrS family aminotransferase [Elusimicrobiota bacterium]
MIPIIDLKAQYETLKPEIDAAIARVIQSGSFILGDEVENLEREIAAYTNTEYAIGVNSGTDALLLALKVYDLGPGDEVITTAFSFFATAEVIAFLGAKPVFVDIAPQDYNIDVNKIEEKITTKTKALIPVHLYGQPAEMNKIVELAKKYKLKVIEDCAQALGAEYHGKRVGGIGDIGCISFFPTKNLGAYGDGGMIVTNDEEVYKKIKKLHLHGAGEKYVHELIGINSRLDTLQAAIVRVKLKYLDQWIKRRREIAEIYNKELSKLPLKLPLVNKNFRQVYNQYTISTDQRDGMQIFLKEKQVGTAIHYPISLPLQQAFAYLKHKQADFPEAVRAAETALSLPVYPELETKQINQVIGAIKVFHDKNRLKVESKKTE